MVNSPLTARRPAWSWTAPEPPPAPPRLGLAGLARLALRGAGLAVLVPVTFLGLVTAGRVSPQHRARIVQWGCRIFCTLLGFRPTKIGAPAADSQLIVANHATWLDVFVLAAQVPVVFVAKRDVAAWPGIGAVVRAAGTVFIDRDQGTVEQGIATLKAALDRGDRLVLFAEGTSSDGQRVLPFRSSLFAAVAAGTRVQPVALRYTAPPGRDQRFYGWWAPMPFGPSLRTVLAQAPQGRVSLSFLPVRDAPGPTGRKSFAADLETAIRARFTAMGR